MGEAMNAVIYFWTTKPPTCTRSYSRTGLYKVYRMSTVELYLARPGDGRDKSIEHCTQMEPRGGRAQLATKTHIYRV